MGHYDYSYEHVNKLIRKESIAFHKKTINNFSKKASLQDLAFIADVIENIDDYKGFHNTIKLISKNA